MIVTSWDGMAGLHLPCEDTAHGQVATCSWSSTELARPFPLKFAPACVQDVCLCSGLAGHFSLRRDSVVLFFLPGCISFIRGLHMLGPQDLSAPASACPFDCNDAQSCACGSRSLSIELLCLSVLQHAFGSAFTEPGQFALRAPNPSAFESADDVAWSFLLRLFAFLEDQCLIFVRSALFFYLLSCIHLFLFACPLCSQRPAINMAVRQARVCFRGAPLLWALFLVAFQLPLRVEAVRSPGPYGPACASSVGDSSCNSAGAGSFVGPSERNGGGSSDVSSSAFQSMVDVSRAVEPSVSSNAVAHAQGTAPQYAPLEARPERKIWAAVFGFKSTPPSSMSFRNLKRNGISFKLRSSLT